MTENRYIHCPNCGESYFRCLETPGAGVAVAVGGVAANVFFVTGLLTGGLFWIIGAPVVMGTIIFANDKIQEEAGAPQYRCKNCLHTWR